MPYDSKGYSYTKKSANVVTPQFTKKEPKLAKTKGASSNPKGRYSEGRKGKR